MKKNIDRNSFEGSYNEEKKNEEEYSEWKYLKSKLGLKSFMHDKHLDGLNKVKLIL